MNRRLLSVFDYFSIDLLVKTLFSPYRQISSGRVDGPLGLQIRAFFDNLLSRIIGAVLRTIVMVIGVVSLIALAIINIVVLVVWGMVPALPIVGLTLTLIGWAPWTV